MSEQWNEALHQKLATKLRHTTNEEILERLKHSMKWKIQVIVVPVSDIEQSKQFYAHKLGFRVDVDQEIGEDFRIVQLTPEGSKCSITLGQVDGLSQMPPGSLKGLQIVVSDILEAYQDLSQRGVNISPIRHVAEDGSWQDGQGGPWNSFIFFEDPDGNSWAIQEAA